MLKATEGSVLKAEAAGRSVLSDQLAATGTWFHCQIAPSAGPGSGGMDSADIARVRGVHADVRQPKRWRQSEHSKQAAHLPET